jgi:hypothetical protein
MVSTFNSAASPVSEAEQALQAWGVTYERRADGTLFVEGNLNISDKGFARLPDLSCVSVGGHFLCGRNKLTSLEGAPQIVVGNFICNYNHLTSLKGAPLRVGGSFRCDNNRLTSLEHGPKSIGSEFHCIHNPLASLEGAPRNFQYLRSNLGRFTSWWAVPVELRTSPQTKARLELERQAALDHAIHVAIVLQAPMQVRRPLSFKGFMNS